MLLGGGAVNGSRILAPLTVSRMTSAATPAGEPNVRGFGWDIDSSYSVNRGEFLPLGSFGHTGIHGDLDLDRPGKPRVRDLPLEPAASGRIGRRHAASRASRDSRRLVVDRRRCRDARPDRLDAAVLRVADSCGAGAARFSPCWRASTCFAPRDSRRSQANAWPCSPITRAATGTARRRSICSPTRRT